MKNVALNTEYDGTCRTIKAQYYKNSTANFCRTDSFGASGVLVIRLVKSAAKTANIMNNYIIVASRGRNPDNPNLRDRGLPTEKRLEPNLCGVCNTITIIQKDNLLLEIKPNEQLHCCVKNGSNR